MAGQNTSNMKETIIIGGRTFTHEQAAAIKEMSELTGVDENSVANAMFSETYKIKYDSQELKDILPTLLNDRSKRRRYNRRAKRH